MFKLPSRKPAGNPGLPVIRRTSLELPVRLTEEEHRERGVSLAEAQLRVKLHETEMKERIKELKRAHKDLEEERDRLMWVVGERAEPRVVECEIRADFASGKAQIVRVDTGEVVETRDLTDDEIDAEQDLFARTSNRDDRDGNRA